MVPAKVREGGEASKSVSQMKLTSLHDSAEPTAAELSGGSLGRRQSEKQ